MGILKAPVTLIAVAGFAFTLGCRMCASPHDYTGPVISAGGECDCHHSGRAGSAFVGAAKDEHEVLASAQETAPAAVNKTRHFVASSSSIADEYAPRRLGRPLTRDDIDPFVRLGIPAENILSVTDRPVDEMVTQQDHGKPHSLTADAGKQPRPLPSAEKADDPTSTGWVRLGNRTSATMR